MNTVPTPITTCGIYITRRCNLACGHCSVTKPGLPIYELSLAEWQSAFQILKNLGISKVSILGGEPTVYPHIVEIVRFNRKMTDIDLAVVSNSMSEINIYEQLVEAGLQRFSASIDIVNGHSFDSCSAVKSGRSLEVLKLMKEMGIKNLTGYCVLRPENAGQIEKIVEMLSGLGIWFYMLPFHAGHGNHWQTRLRNQPKAFGEKDRKLLEDLSGRIIALKEGGALISNTVEYMQFLPVYAINLDWHCAPAISELRIDADGTLMSCNDIKGKNLSRFTIFSLADLSNLPLILESRAKDTEKCPGCYWPSHYHAEQLRYRKTGEQWIWQKETPG